MASVVFGSVYHFQGYLPRCMDRIGINHVEWSLGVEMRSYCGIYNWQAWPHRADNLTWLPIDLASDWGSVYYIKSTFDFLYPLSFILLTYPCHTIWISPTPTESLYQIPLTQAKSPKAISNICLCLLEFFPAAIRKSCSTIFTLILWIWQFNLIDTSNPLNVSS